MAGSRALSENIWPGYVAAMASLLLGLLLLVALLTITAGQLSNIQDDYAQAIRDLGYRSHQQVLEVSRALGVDVDALLNEARNVPESEEVAAARAPAGLLDGRDLGQAAGDGHPMAAYRLLDFSNFTYDRKAARLAMERLSKADAELLQAVNLSQVDLRKIRFPVFEKPLMLAGDITPQMLRRVDFSQVNFGKMDAGLQEQIKPFLARLALEALMDGKKTVLKPRPPELSKPEVKPIEPVRTLPELTSQGEPALLLDFVDRVQLPDAKVLDVVSERLRSMRKAGQTLRLWVQDHAEPDVAQVRSANLQLLRIRTLALQAGWPGEHIHVKYTRNAAAISHQNGFHIHISTAGDGHE